MKLTPDQAKLLLAADPFVIVQMVIDDEGYRDYDYEALAVASNVAWDAKELDGFVRDNHPERSSELRSCQADYLCHIKENYEDYPQYGSFWELVEAELLSSEPFPSAVEPQHE